MPPSAWAARMRSAPLPSRRMRSISSSAGSAGVWRRATSTAAAIRSRTGRSAPSYRAGRDGLDATVWHDGALRPVRERIAAAVELARRHTPAEPALEEVERILRDGNGADRMRAAHAEGGMPRVLHRLIEESAEALGVSAPAA